MVARRRGAEEHVTSTRVIYLIGTTRCGSTLLGSLLDQAPGVVHVGEVARIWQEGLVQNHRCGCGVPLRDCPFWYAVLDRAFGGRDAVDPQRMIALVMQSARTRHAMKLATARGRAEMRAATAEYSDAMARLYAAIAAEAGERIVLDSSKTPLLAWVVSERPDIDLRVLHVTRDPRAVAYSWRRKKFDPAKGKDMHREGPIKTSLAWLAWNGLAASIWERGDQSRYLHLRYEDLTADPHAALNRIFGWLGEETRADAVIDPERRFASRPAHTVAGNPMRFAKGATRIKADTEWQAGSSRWDRLLVAGVTWPLLGKYHYPLRVRE
jgi:hypothetical protein